MLAMSTRGHVGSWSRVSTLFAGVAAVMAATGCVTDDEPDLAQTSQASYSLAPTALLFPDTIVGGTSSSQTVTLAPVGFTIETINNLIYSCPDFLITWPGLSLIHI